MDFPYETATLLRWAGKEQLSKAKNVARIRKSILLSREGFLNSHGIGNLRQLAWRPSQKAKKSRKIDERKAEKSGEKKFKKGQKVEMESSRMW